MVRLCCCRKQLKMKRIGVIDIGTNSVLLLVCQYNKAKIEPILDLSEITRLGEGVQKTGLLSDVAMKRTAEQANSYLEICKQKRVSEVKAIGTSALRDAANSEDFVRRVKEQSGLDVEIISGEKEAELSYIAVSQDPVLKPNLDYPLIVIDVGGGSTEIVVGDESVKNLYSFNIGAVRANDLFLKNEPPLQCEIDALTEHVRSEVGELNLPAETAIVGIGGTITNLAAVKLKQTKYDREKIHSLTIKNEEISRQIELYCSMPLEKRREITGLEPKRADVIIGGAVIFRAILEAIGSSQIIVSARGLRYGIAYIKAQTMSDYLRNSP